MTTLLIIMLAVALIFFVLVTYVVLNQRQIIRSLETKVDDYHDKLEFEKISHRATRNDHFTELRESKKFSREIESFHLQNEAALTEELRRAHSMVEMLIDAGIDENFQLTRINARHLFVV